MHHHIDSLAYTNGLRSLPPEHKLWFAIALFILSYLAPIIVQLLITLWLLFWIVSYARIPLKTYLKLLTIPLSFLWLSLPALFIGVSLRDKISTLGLDVIWGVSIGQIYFYLSQQGWEQAQIVLARSISLTSCMYFVLLTIPFVEILRILKGVGCPPLITELLTLMYRFIFVLTDTVAQLLTAQQARMGYNSWRSSMRSLGLVVSQLLRCTLENYRQISLGLNARGFNGELRVWSSRSYQTSLRYIGEAIGGYLVLLIMAGCYYAHGI